MSSLDPYTFRSADCRYLVRGLPKPPKKPTPRQRRCFDNDDVFYSLWTPRDNTYIGICRVYCKDPVLHSLLTGGEKLSPFQRFLKLGVHQ